MGRASALHNISSLQMRGVYVKMGTTKIAVHASCVLPTRLAQALMEHATAHQLIKYLATVHACVQTIPITALEVVHPVHHTQ